MPSPAAVDLMLQFQREGTGRAGVRSGDLAGELEFKRRGCAAAWSQRARVHRIALSGTTAALTHKAVGVARGW